MSTIRHDLHKVSIYPTWAQDKGTCSRVQYPAKDYLVKEVAETGRRAMSQQSDSHQKKTVD